MPEDNGFQRFVNTFTGGDDGWGVSTSGLVVFLVVLIVAVAMLIVNGVYFIKVYDGSNDEDLNNYWSRGGALTLAIVNFFFAVLLFIEFYFILRIILNKNTKDDSSCIKNIGADIDPITGLPNPKLTKVLEQANLAYATANPRKSGYVEGIPRAGVLENGIYISPDYLTTAEGYNTLRKTVKDERDKYALYDTISNTKESDTVDNLLLNYDRVKDNYSIDTSITAPFVRKRLDLLRRDADTATYKRELLNTNPPFDPTKHYERDTEYNIRKLDDQLNLLKETPSYINSKVFNPAPSGRTPYSDLLRRVK